MKKIVHYINQFFAGKGGEDVADYKIEVIDGNAGPGFRQRSATVVKSLRRLSAVITILTITPTSVWHLFKMF